MGFYKSASTWLQKRFFIREQGFHQLLDPFTFQSLLTKPTDAEFDAETARLALDPERRRAREAGLVPTLTAEILSGDILRGAGAVSSYADRLRMVFEEGRVLIVTREQRQLIRSLYKTMVLMGMNQSLRQLLTPGDQEQGFTLDFIRFDRLAAIYRDRFGGDAVLVLPYELLKSSPREFLDRIREHSGLPPLSDQAYSSLPIDEPMNVNQSLAYLHAQRWLNRLLQSHRRDYAGPMQLNRKQVWKRIAWHKRNARPTRLDPLLERRFMEQVVRCTEGVFAESNARLQCMCSVDLRSLGYEITPAANSQPGSQP